MTQFDKQLQRLQSYPKNFTFRELQSLLHKCGYKMNTKGKTSGSRIAFKGSVAELQIHQPHDRNVLLKYEIDAALTFLRKEGII